jgi:putative hydrolase of HD superfamily
MLKMIPRSGWISHGVAVQETESVADHSFATAVIAMLLADLEAKEGRRVNVESVLRMAMLHDLAETLTFDISKSYLQYLGKRGEAVKKELEQAAWAHMVKGVPSRAIEANYLRLQDEFNAEETLESQIVHAADKLDILFQVIEYHRRGYPKPTLVELWSTTNRALKNVPLSSVRKLHKIAMKLYRTEAERLR